MAFCQVCGQACPEDAVFCTECGARQRETAEEETPKGGSYHCVLQGRNAGSRWLFAAEDTVLDIESGRCVVWIPNLSDEKIEKLRRESETPMSVFHQGEFAFHEVESVQYGKAFRIKKVTVMAIVFLVILLVTACMDDRAWLVLTCLTLLAFWLGGSYTRLLRIRLQNGKKFKVPYGKRDLPAVETLAWILKKG